MAFALLAARWIAGVFSGVSPHDPWAYAGVAVMTMVLAAGAGLLRARRAAAVDPIEALRAD
jgi:ABC-type lipoprotein release transport system permease subunit